MLSLEGTGGGEGAACTGEGTGGVFPAKGGSERRLTDVVEAGGGVTLPAGGPEGGGGGGGALALLIEPWESEVPLPTLATDATDVKVDDLTRICAFLGIGGSRPTRGPPCCRIYSLINSRLSAIISSVMP